MKLIVGLGNPGNEYTKTRHNVGFMAIARLASRHGLTGAKAKFHSNMLDGQIAGHRCVLLEPTTFMNRSGLAVREAVGFYKLDPVTDLLVMVDDVALSVGQIRLRAEGGTGGHNGLADIQQALGTPSYPRLRIGIDPPGRVVQSDYVLGRFTPEQVIRIDSTLDRVCDAAQCWLHEGIAQAMNKYNTNSKTTDADATES